MSLNLISLSTLCRTAALATVLALVGCATLGGTPEESVAKRADEYWKARVAGQVDKAYTLSTPSYRKLRTAEQFRMQFGTGVTVQGADVVKVTCEAEKCTARMKISVKPALAGLKLDTMAVYLDEVWLLEDGQWWRYQEL